jgi:hypothetical protein
LSGRHGDRRHRLGSQLGRFHDQAGKRNQLELPFSGRGPFLAYSRLDLAFIHQVEKKRKHSKSTSLSLLLPGTIDKMLRDDLCRRGFLHYSGSFKDTRLPRIGTGKEGRGLKGHS